MPVPDGLDEGPAAAIAVLVSGEGTILEALAERSRSGRLGAPIVLVLSDRVGAPALRRAEAAGLPTSTVPRRPGDVEAWAEVTHAALRRARVTLVVLDGFLTILPPSFIERWHGRILNVHPSLLPKFGGAGMFGDRVHAAVLAAGETETGVTVHEVTSAVDAGPIRAQRRVAVQPGDTVASLRERLRPIEIDALASAIASALAGQ